MVENIRSIFPASFRAGTTTDTEGNLEGRTGVVRRATIMLVSAKTENGQILTRILLQNGPIAGTEKGNKTSCQLLIISNPARPSRFAMSSTVSQFC